MLGGTCELKLPVTQWRFRFTETEKSSSVGMWCLSAAFFEEGREKKTIPCTTTVHSPLTWHRPSRQSSSQATRYKCDCTALEPVHNWVYCCIYRISPLSSDTPWETAWSWLWAGNVLQHTDRISWLRMFWWECRMALYLYHTMTVLKNPSPN